MGVSHDPYMIVTHHDSSVVKVAYAKALQLFPIELLTPIMRGTTNYVTGFMVWPSGSQLGWATEVAHAKSLDELTTFINTLPHPPKCITVVDSEQAVQPYIQQSGEKQ